MHEELAQIGMDVGEMQRAVAGVEQKLDQVVARQDQTNRGVRILCQVAEHQHPAPPPAGGQHPALPPKAGP